MKSPALKETVGPLSRIGSEMARDNAAAMARWFSLPPPVKKITPQPPRPQVMTMNATPEAAQVNRKSSRNMTALASSAAGVQSCLTRVFHFRHFQ